MVRLQCRNCGFDRKIEWDGTMRCPGCGASDVRVAALVEDLPADFLERMTRATSERLDDGPEAEE